MDRLDSEESGQSRQWQWLWWAIPIVVAVGLAGALYYGRQQQQQPVTEQAEAEPDAPAAETPLHHPIEPEAQAGESTLPALGQSDVEIKDALAGAVGGPIEQFLVPKDIVRHTVTTIDNLARKKTAVQKWPLKPTDGALVVSGTDELTLSEENYARYEPAIKIMKSTDASAVAALYRRYYPLFQQAYADLGYPDGYFNDRLIAGIDHLLETPEVQGPIKFTHPSVHYEFADPELENRSAGQKLLIRMGSSNAAAVKLKLRELRRQIAAAEEG
jgi:hypothetical protein